MDSYKRLKTELNGIKDIISSYTRRGDIINYLNQLEYSLSNDDIEITLYCLENIVNWYNQKFLKYIQMSMFSIKKNIEKIKLF